MFRRSRLVPLKTAITHRSRIIEPLRRYFFMSFFFCARARTQVFLLLPFIGPQWGLSSNCGGREWLLMWRQWPRTGYGRFRGPRRKVVEGEKKEKKKLTKTNGLSFRERFQESGNVHHR